MISEGQGQDKADGNPLHLLRHPHGKRGPAGGQDRTNGSFGGRLTLKLAVNAELMWWNCILAMKNGQKIRPKRPETENGLKMRHKGSVSYDILSKTDKMFDWYVY